MPPSERVRDGAMPDLSQMLEPAWAWHLHRLQFGGTEQPPPRLRPVQFSLEPGVRAVAMYSADWRLDGGLDEGDFAVEMSASSAVRAFRYPEDPYLPGLTAAASPNKAQELLATYVGGVAPQRVHVSAVRYRATRRAVLRHGVSWGRGSRATFYVRVMPPPRLARFLEAGKAASLSGFVVPRLAGHWIAGGVAWLSAVPGETARAGIRRGEGIPPERLLDALEPLWAASTEAPGRPLNVASDFRYTRGVLERVLVDGPTFDLLRGVCDPIEAFTARWSPSALAHNDFYDSQVIVTADGRPAIVDFEEVGPGDPLIDVGNMLAHLRWQARFQPSEAAAAACAEYRRAMRATALERYAWDESDLDVREAYSMFRLASNPARHQRDDWQAGVGTALGLVRDALEGRDPVAVD